MCVCVCTNTHILKCYIERSFFRENDLQNVVTVLKGRIEDVDLGVEKV